MVDLHSLPYRKSSYSGVGQDQQCVAVADIPDGGGSAVLDTKNPTGPVLAVPLTAWGLFARAVKAGEFRG